MHNCLTLTCTKVSLTKSDVNVRKISKREEVPLIDVVSPEMFVTTMLFQSSYLSAAHEIYTICTGIRNKDGPRVVSGQITSC